MIPELAGTGDVGKPEANAGELASEELGVGLGAFGDAAVDLGLHAVPFLLAVLGQQDQRRGVGGLQREQQGEADELLLVEAHVDRAERVPAQPTGRRTRFGRQGTVRCR